MISRKLFIDADFAKKLAIVLKRKDANIRGQLNNFDARTSMIDMLAYEFFGPVAIVNGHYYSMETGEEVDVWDDELASLPRTTSAWRSLVEKDKITSQVIRNLLAFEDEDLEIDVANSILQSVNIRSDKKPSFKDINNILSATNYITQDLYDDF